MQFQENSHVDLWCLWVCSSPGLRVRTSPRLLQMAQAHFSRVSFQHRRLCFLKTHLMKIKPHKSNAYPCGKEGELVS